MRSPRFFVFLLLAVAAVPARAQLWTGVIAPSRAVDWSQAGVAGGVPKRTTICATLSPGASAAQISSALSSCPSGQVVFLNAGTYNLSSGIIFDNKSNVTLRGSGADQTFLVFSGANGCRGTASLICFASADTNYQGSPSNLANWTAGYARGTTVITLSGTPNLAVGNPIMLDQQNDTTDSGDVYVCSTVGTCSGGGDGGSERPGRSQQQMVTVRAINGNQVTISPALYDNNWRSGQSPQAWWATSPIAGDGVENLSVDNTPLGIGSTANIQFFNCQNCWAKGVRSIMANRSHVMMFQANRITVRDSYFYQSINHQSVSYGVEAIPSSDSLVENNIFQGVTAPKVMTGSCEGCVFSYDFSIDDEFSPTTWENQSDFLHAGGDQWILFEGNVGVGIYSDNFHGTHQFITAFRNRYDGYELNAGSPPNSNTIPMIILAFSRFYNLIGNVLGSTARPDNNYEFDIGASGAPDQSIYEVGVGDQVPNDTNTARTLMRWGNYDVVNNAVRFVSAEVPTGILNFANLLPISQALPASFYLSFVPSWWPSGKPWPPIGPDVTGGNIPSVGGHAYTIPAEDCYLNTMVGPSDGTGNVLSFNAGNCYGSIGSSSVAPPTNLQVVVQ